jgi:hypothetical protein
VIGHGGGLLQRPAVLEIGRDAGRPETVVTDLGRDAGGELWCARWPGCVIRRDGGRFKAGGMPLRTGRSSTSGYLRVSSQRSSKMPNQRLLMRQIREVLRHKYALGLSEREIGRALGISKSGVGDTIRRARSCELT